MAMRVKVYAPPKRKRYLAELIGKAYWDWRGKKILISAPTGMGKSTFIVEILLFYLRGQRRKILICCNRRLLRTQYWNSLIEKFDSYGEIEECVSVVTYQQMSEKIKNGGSLKRFFDDFEVIVCDECHFFYADSDFNGFGTYALLQEIACAGIQKEMIFMSATMKEVRPLIERTIENCVSRLERTGRNARISEDNRKIEVYDFSSFADYSRFHCIYVPDLETVCQLLAESQKKSVVFIDDKAKGADLMEQLVKTGKLGKQKIALLNADNIDSDSELVRELAIANRLLPQVLITTSVLDNGVSIHDPDVGNVLIITESRISFLQMLGRIRSENVNQCNLYFVRRDQKEFSKRMERYKEELNDFKGLTTGKLRKNREYFMQAMFDGSGDERADFYRKALVWMKFESQFYVWPENECKYSNQEYDFYVNEFSKLKTGNMYLAESHFYSSAVKDPLQVVYDQMVWIGKEPEELEIRESEYHKTREQEFVKRLLSVQKFTSEDMKGYKVQLVKEFKKEFFDDILSNNGTISNEKLKEICVRFDLELLETDSENRKKLYTIKAKGTMEDESC